MRPQTSRDRTPCDVRTSSSEARITPHVVSDVQHDSLSRKQRPVVKETKTDRVRRR